MNGHLAQNEAAFAQLVAAEQEHLRWQEEKVRLIERVLREELLRGGSAQALGDVGCFTGLATRRYRDTGYARAVGFDASEAALARVREHGLEGRSWLAGTAPCPAEEGEFSALVAADVIEHIVDTDAFVSELRRVTRPGGLLVVTTPNLAFWLSRLRLALGRVPWSFPGASPTVRADSQVDNNHIRVTTRAEWEALFRSQGLGVERVLGWSILGAIQGGAKVRVQRALDRRLTAWPELAFGLLFQLRRP